MVRAVTARDGGKVPERSKHPTYQEVRQQLSDQAADFLRNRPDLLGPNAPIEPRRLGVLQGKMRLSLEEALAPLDAAELALWNGENTD